jgi:hypothetical protein
MHIVSCSGAGNRAAAAAVTCRFCQVQEIFEQCSALSRALHSIACYVIFGSSICKNVPNKNSPEVTI